mmetsp:Transcript_23887/g.70014  ORF Transcript_23887/g.70014 Transcript_23887/m.70014 type:complete len:339 (-) Transcript_23887:230-1246(-)
MDPASSSGSASQPPPAPAPAADAGGPGVGKGRAVAALVVGMAGSGKTTLMQRLNLHCAEQKRPAYYVNMDPATRTVPFSAGIDIRDTVDYKQVMQKYGLGPNGAIMTSLNLFATRFDQVLDILEKRSAEGVEHVFLDTPGQIEAFTWSASGMIITETLALQFPTVLLFVVDTPRTSNPTTFMSNMLYACSILYKTHLPIVLVLNKTDVTPADFAMEWMSDFEKFQEALDSARSQSYLTSLNRSMALMLEEFYRNLRAVPVSAASGEGISDLLDAIQAAAGDYEQDYLPEIQRRKREAEEKERQRQVDSMDKLMQDMRMPPPPGGADSDGEGSSRNSPS